MTTQGDKPHGGPSYLAALDPWRRSSSRDVEWLLKLAALTVRRTVISDNQALNNSGLHRVLRRADMLEFLCSLDGDGGPPLSIALREGTQHFEEVAQRLVVGRRQPAIFPWMSSAQQARLDAAYAHDHSSTVGPLFDIAGPEFRDHIERVERIRRSNPAATTHWSGLENGYVIAAAKAVRQFRDSLRRDSLGSEPSGAIALCDTLLEQVQSGTEVNRSNLYRITSHAGLDRPTDVAIRLKCLDEPYHENFAAMTNCNSITGGEYREAEVAKLLTAVAGRLLQLRPIDVFEIDEFPLLLDEVPLARISALRGLPSYLNLLDELATADEDEKRVRLISDLLNHISAEFAKEPKGLRKLSRLRLHVFSPPRQLAEDFVASGISLSDVVAFASKATGFIVGETVGHFVGVFAVGGALGTGAAVIVEQVARRAYERPKKRREFQQVLQLMVAASHNRA
jgi:hypothetical protein